MPPPRQNGRGPRVRRPVCLAYAIALLALLTAGFSFAQRTERVPVKNEPQKNEPQKNEPQHRAMPAADGARPAGGLGLSGSLPAGGGVASAPRIATGRTDVFGQPITVSCASCHSNFKPHAAAASGERLEQFHQGLRFKHGTLACLSCHNKDNYNLLRLAGGESLDYAQTRALCGQCHARQNRDFEHGAHGGRNGYWDATRGTRIRKSCGDCHDPHAPALPAMLPTFKPRDRFLAPSHGGAERTLHE